MPLRFFLILLEVRMPPGVYLAHHEARNSDPGESFNNGYGGVLPNLTLTGGSAYGGGFSVNTGYFPWQNSNPTYSYRDTITKTLKNHTLIFGASSIFAQKNEPSTGFNQGSVTFNTSSTVTTGNAFADLLEARIAQFTQTSAQPKYYNLYKIVEPYVQDNWRATPKLTLNLGLRLSLFGTYQDISDQSGNFEPNTWSAANPPTIDGISTQPDRHPYARGLALRAAIQSLRAGRAAQPRDYAGKLCRQLRGAFAHPA
jgi:hypothetical protein